MASTIPLSPYMLLSPGVATVVGLIATGVRCVAAGGRYGGTLHFMRCEWRLFALIGVLDAFGGALLAGFIWGVSPPRISVLLELSRSLPAVFWSLIGVGGPVAISGAMRLLPTKKTATIPAFVFDNPKLVLQVVVLRRQLTGALYEALGQSNDSWMKGRSDWLLLQASAKAKSGELDPRALMRCMSRSLDRERDGRPRRAGDMKRLSEFKNDAAFGSNNPLVYQELIARMAEMAVDLSLEDALATSCKIRLFEYNEKIAYPLPDQRITPGEVPDDIDIASIDFEEFEDPIHPS